MPIKYRIVSPFSDVCPGLAQGPITFATVSLCKPDHKLVLAANFMKASTLSGDVSLYFAASWIEFTMTGGRGLPQPARTRSAMSVNVFISAYSKQI